MVFAVRIWTIKIGEPLPVEGCHSRLFRNGLLSRVLSERGHEVTWWTSTFLHQEKRQLFEVDTAIPITDHFRVVALRTPGYSANISVQRVVDHVVMSRRFARRVRLENPPDLIICAFPAIQLTRAAIDYGKALGVPTIVDVRDLWPDVFVHALPSGLREIGSIPALAITRSVRRCMRNATALTAMSHGCLEWALEHAARAQSQWDWMFPLGYPELDVDARSVERAGASLREKGVDSAKIICWFLGMFGKQYDLSTVIAAASELERRDSHNVQFVLSGDGPAMPKLQRIGGTLSNVVFTGRIGPAEIAYMSRVSLIGLLAADNVPESLPNKLFEYLAAGLPVLSSLSGETEAFIRDAECGLTYSPRDSAGLIAALELLLSNPELRREMGRRSRRVFETGYSADVVYGRMASHLERIVSEYRRGQQG